MLPRVYPCELFVRKFYLLFALAFQFNLAGFASEAFCNFGCVHIVIGRVYEARQLPLPAFSVSLLAS